MKVTGKTNIGLVRRENQDAFVTGQLSDRRVFAVVCDGMGGANGGSVASEMAVRRVADRLAAVGDESEMSFGYVFESALAAANIDIYDKARETPALAGMGTTVVAAVASPDTLCVAHVGDSRAYLLRDGNLQQITRDHSVVQQMIERGQLTKTEARTHPRKNFITRALGVENTVLNDYTEMAWHPGDRLLLCTDGLTNMVEDTVIQTLLEEPEAVDKLIEAALAAGGNDNITVCLIECD